MTKRTYSQDYQERRKASEIAKIHIAKQQLGWDDETYRAILQREGGVNSAKELTPLGRAKILDYAKGQGFQTKKGYPGQPHNLHSQADKAKLTQKIGALLADLQLPWEYAIGIARQMYKKEKLEFCSSHELWSIVNALIKKQSKERV